MKLTSITLYLFSPFLLLAGYRGIINTLRMRFTTETAREYALKSHAPDSARFLPKPPIVDPLPNTQLTAPSADSLYNLKMLARVRKQLDRLFSMFADEPDPMKLDRLASAIARLSELERQLANRPLPGTLRPAAPSKAQRTTQGPSLPPAAG